MTEEVWVYAEQREGRIVDASYQLLNKGGEIAEKLGAALSVVILGRDMRREAEKLGALGVEKVYLVESENLDPYSMLPYKEALLNAVEQHQPQAVLFPATSQSLDLAPRVSVSLGVGLLSNCVDLVVGEGGVLIGEKQLFEGKAHVKLSSPRSKPQMASLLTGFLQPLENPEPKECAIIRVEYEPITWDAEVLGITSKVREGAVDISGANVIVAGGRGMGTGENFKQLFKIAELLGGAVGGSRAAVDAGWISYERQVGLSGKVVRPEVYVAFGISGASQHVAGMVNSKHVISVNTDPYAPIFNYSEYAFVGDASEVISFLIEEIEKAKDNRER
ncbi:MAG: electron transfer flavoprotein subunit alpha [Nitrososphaeria archaeon]|nr:electron transfer flavoprotein subunit alpha [Nitrososphaeria archaeon]NIN53393.1 electron transfer flavoprotein subunit alpha [Nitrososphaeria archaeon]NIQ33905.1 electron transfer flavoprotein subunit alpha [Nitrososphaeria archaeon]